MTKSWTMFKQMIIQIGRDMIFVLLLITPFLAGAVIRFGIPVIEGILCTYFGKTQIISPYYFLLDWMISLLPGMMFLFTGGLIILGEIDDKIAGYMSVTPAGNSGYLFSRLGYPAIISFFVDTLVLCMFNLSGISAADIIILSATSSLMGVITALLVIAISTNKVEGMAIGKLSGMVGLGMFVPAFTHGAVSYIAGVLPSFWIGKYLVSRNPMFIIVFVAVFMAWLMLLISRYNRKRI